MIRGRVPAEGLRLRARRVVEQAATAGARKSVIGSRLSVMALARYNALSFGDTVRVSAIAMEKANERRLIRFGWKV